MEPVVERRDHSEVAAAAAQPPKHVGMLIDTCGEKLAICGDQVAGHQAVAGEPEAAHQVADPTSKGQPADPGVGDDAAGYRHPKGLALVVDVAPQTSPLGPDRPHQRVHPSPVMLDRSTTSPPSQ